MQTNEFLDELGNVKRENAMKRFGMTNEQAEAFAEVFKEGFCTAMSMVAEIDPREMVQEIDFYNSLHWKYKRAEWLKIMEERNSKK